MTLEDEPVIVEDNEADRQALRDSLRGEIMKYQNTMLCSGYSHKLKPCEHIMNCDLCTGPFVDTNGNERYVCGPGVTDFKCKRDNPFWRPLTQREFVDLYNKMPGKTVKNVDEILQRAIAEGIVEE